MTPLESPPMRGLEFLLPLFQWENEIPCLPPCTNVNSVFSAVANFIGPPSAFMSPSKAGKQVIMPILQMGKWFVGTVGIKLTAASGGVLLGVRKTGVNCRSCLL